TRSKRDWSSDVCSSDLLVSDYVIAAQITSENILLTRRETGKMKMRLLLSFVWSLSIMFCKRTRANFPTILDGKQTDRTFVIISCSKGIACYLYVTRRCTCF